MTQSVGVHEAKTHLSRLLDQVSGGEEVVITRRGQDIARLVPERGATRHFGIDEGRFEVPDEFDAPLPEDVLDTFER